MKRSGLTLMAILLMAFPMFSQDSKVSIPDTAFLHALINEGVDTNGDGQISYAEALEITSLTLSGWEGRMASHPVCIPKISSLKGIESFINLDSLTVKCTSIDSLNLSNNLALTFLYCSSNPFDTLDFSNNLELRTLFCSYNNLTSLKLPLNGSLEYLDAGTNALTEIDVSTNPLLTHLNLRDNALEAIDISGLPLLTELQLSINNLTNLDVSACNKLENLKISGNNISKIDISNCTLLETFWASGNQFECIDLSKCNRLNSIYLQTMPTLYEVCVWEGFDQEEVSSSSISDSPNLYFSTECVYNNDSIVFIPDTAFLHALIEVGVDTNGDGLISYEEAEKVTKVEIQNNADNPGEIKNMKGIEAFVNTLYLNCSSHQITNLDISNNTSLVNLECHNNKLPVLDISNNTVLEYLSCGTNQLASLDVSQNILLEKLNCSNNQLTNISLNDSLRFLSCSNNQLTNIDVADCSKLWLLNCFNNKLSSLDITNNNGLIRLQCGGNQLTNLDVSECHDLAVLSIGNNDIIFSEWYVMLLQWEYKWDIEPNPILSLDLTNENSISALECGGLNISSLDLRGLELSYLILNHMPELTQVCVDSISIDWCWPPVCIDRDTTGSPNVYFSTECSGTGIEETNLSGFTIYPNPTNSLLTIETAQSDHYSIEITSLNGQQILSGEIEGTSHQIDLSSFKEGVYFITIRAEDFVHTRKIVKL